MEERLLLNVQRCGSARKQQRAVQVSKVGPQARDPIMAGAVVACTR